MNGVTVIEETIAVVQMDDAPQRIVEIAEQGPPGVNLTGYVHTQISAETVWTVNHNLGYRGNVEVRTPGGMLALAEVLHVSANQLTITFDQPQAGTARVV